MAPNDDRTSALPGAPPTAADTASLGHTGPGGPAPELANVGKYRVVGLLGQGGMGGVYLAEDTVLCRPVALKVMLPRHAADPAARARFLREARAQAAVSHDHVLPIFDVLDDGPVPAIAMPVLKGMSLADALKANSRPPLAEVVRIAREAADGLAAAHATGLVHRDIKPGNIWLEDGRLRVKVLDFGLARLANDGDHPTAGSDSSFILPPSSLTQTGAVLGTPAYMSPEQALGRPLDARTDLFSLGVVLYQMATGRLPFPGRTTADVMAAVVRHDPPAPADLPPQLAALVMRLLAKNPADRPPTAAAVAGELRGIEATLTTTSAPAAEPWGDILDAPATLTEARPPARPAGPRWVLPVFAGLGLLVVGAVAAGVAWYRSTDVGVIEVADAGAEDVPLTVTQDGKVIADRTTARRLTLPVGKYAVDVSDPNPTVTLTPAGPVTLTRGGKASLTLTRSAAKVERRKLDEGYFPDDPAWLKLFLAQPPKAQVARFVKELQRLNPDFDGNVAFKDEAGKVVSLDLDTRVVSNLAPVRALRALRRFGASGPEYRPGVLTDVAALDGLDLEALNLRYNPPCRDLRVIGKMTKLSWLGITVAESRDLAALGPVRLGGIMLGCPASVDLADVAPHLNDTVGELYFIKAHNLAALRDIRIDYLQAFPELFAEPAAESVRVSRVMAFGLTAQLATSGRYLRRNPAVLNIESQPARVFWAFHDLSPRHLSPAWRVLGPWQPSDDDPFDPTADEGRLPPAVLAAPVPSPSAPPVPWKTVVPDPTGMVDYGVVVSRTDPTIAWLHSPIRADAAGRAVLFVGGHPAHQVWLNGVPVLPKPVVSSSRRMAVLVDLKPGENYVTVRATAGVNEYGGQLSFHLHRLRPGEAPPAGIDPPAAAKK